MAGRDPVSPGPATEADRPPVTPAAGQQRDVWWVDEEGRGGWFWGTVRSLPDGALSVQWDLYPEDGPDRIPAASVPARVRERGSQSVHPQQQRRQRASAGGSAVDSKRRRVEPDRLTVGPVRRRLDKEEEEEEEDCHEIQYISDVRTTGKGKSSNQEYLVQYKEDRAGDQFWQQSSRMKEDGLNGAVSSFLSGRLAGRDGRESQTCQACTPSDGPGSPRGVQGQDALLIKVKERCICGAYLVTWEDGPDTWEAARHLEEVDSVTRSFDHGYKKGRELQSSPVVTRPVRMSSDWSFLKQAGKASGTAGSRRARARGPIAINRAQNQVEAERAERQAAEKKAAQNQRLLEEERAAKETAEQKAAESQRLLEEERERAKEASRQKDAKDAELEQYKVAALSMPAVAEQVKRAAQNQRLLEEERAAKETAEQKAAEKIQTLTGGLGFDMHQRIQSERAQESNAQLAKECKICFEVLPAHATWCRNA